MSDSIALQGGEKKMNQKEFGRPTKFFWNVDDFEKDNDWFEVIIGDQDTSIECFRTTYSQLKRFVEFIEEAKKESGKRTVLGEAEKIIEKNLPALKRMAKEAEQQMNILVSNEFLEQLLCGKSDLNPSGCYFFKKKNCPNSCWNKRLMFLLTAGSIEGGRSEEEMRSENLYLGREAK